MGGVSRSHNSDGLFVLWEIDPFCIKNNGRIVNLSQEFRVRRICKSDDPCPLVFHHLEFLFSHSNGGPSCNISSHFGFYPHYFHQFRYPRVKYPLRVAEVFYKPANDCIAKPGNHVEGQPRQNFILPFGHKLGDGGELCYSTEHLGIFMRTRSPSGRSGLGCTSLSSLARTSSRFKFPVPFSSTIF